MARFHTLLESAQAMPTRPVEFIATPPSPDQKSRLYVEAKAVFCLVDDKATRAATKATELAMAEEYKTEKDEPPLAVPQSAYASQYTYETLFRALRDPDEEAASFFQTVNECRNAISPRVASLLFQTYSEWVSDEFPDTMTAAGLKRLEDEAAKKSGAVPPTDGDSATP